MQNVVDVGRDHQLRNRKPHLRRDITSEHVAEITCGDRKSDLPLRCAKPYGGVEIIDHLRHQPRPVDAVHRRQIELLRKGRVVEHRLHERLRIVEAALDRDIMDVGRAHRGHLAPLYVGHAAFGVQHEDVDLLASRNGVDGCRPRVARRRTDNRQMIVTARQEPLEQLPQQLQRDILEREGRAMEKFKQPVLVVQLHQRRHRVVAEPAIGGSTQLAQFVFAK